MNGSEQTFGSVWDAIEDTRGTAASMKLRSSLMIRLQERVAALGVGQAEAAKLMGVTQPRVSDLMRGKVNNFGIESLVDMATAAGLRIELVVSEAA